VQIACGANHSIALTEGGKVYSWGNGQGGKLGHGDQTGKSKPALIESLTSHRVVQVECGDAHSGCITEGGLIFVWGIGLNGRLGNNLTQNFDFPIQIQEKLNNRIMSLYFGMTSSFAILKTG